MKSYACKSAKTYLAHYGGYELAHLCLLLLDSLGTAYIAKLIDKENTILECAVVVFQLIACLVELDNLLGMINWYLVEINLGRILGHLCGVGLCK